MSKHEFTAEILKAKSGGTYVEVPFDVEAAFGKKRVPVNATFDGVPYTGSLVAMGGKCHVLGVLKEIRSQLGKDVGDTIAVTVEEDVAERKVELPDDFRSALDAEPAAREFFGTLSYSRQREFVLWIESAKREETRTQRVRASIEKLSAGEKLR